jgi:pyruvate dehydrogenase E1 component alpha subunit
MRPPFICEPETAAPSLTAGSLPRWTPEELIAFEDDIADEFNASKIKAPVHLYSGNEREMIDVFERVRADDWVLCSWRSHYQCLLKGVPSDEVKSEIMAGHSITLNFPEHRVLSSAIVTGVLPIAVGLGLGIQREGGKERVWCFLGEMTSETGSAHECIKYVQNHELPVHFVIEDNGKSVCTDTRETWGVDTLTYENADNPYVTYYQYETKYPHAGAGQRVQF